MNVDEAGRRAGAELRERFDGLRTPSIEMQPAAPSHRRRGALVAIAIAIAAVLVIALVGPWREPDPAASEGGTWTRQLTRKVFGPNTQEYLMAPGGPGLVALGEANWDKSGARSTPAVWTSTDGEDWTRRRGVVFPRGDFSGFAGLKVDHGTFIAAARGRDDSHVQIWRSTDLWTWRRVARLSAPETQIYLTDVPHGFAAIAMAVPPQEPSIGWTSADGRRWKQIHGVTVSPEEFGLFSQACLGRLEIALESREALNQAPKVFTSRDGLRWSAIPRANPPTRLNSLTSDQSGDRVLGIQYERTHIPGDFGGRLWSTRDGRVWTEITSFHQEMPVANPDHIVQVGRWWVLGGNTGLPDGNRRASMWTSPDLKHWYEMPARLRGPKSGGDAVSVVAHNGKVVGRSSRVIYLWTPPG